MANYPECVGSKIRSKGQGRGMGRGQGKGPVGIPIGQKMEDQKMEKESEFFDQIAQDAFVDELDKIAAGYPKIQELRGKARKQPLLGKEKGRAYAAKRMAERSQATAKAAPVAPSKKPLKAGF